MSPDSGPGAFVAAHPRGSVIAVTVVPRGGRNEIAATADGELRLRIAAPPVDGAANAAVLTFLAEIIGVPRSRLEIVAGERGRRKRILVSGLAPEAVGDRLQALIGVPDT